MPDDPATNVRSRIRGDDRNVAGPFFGRTMGNRKPSVTRLPYGPPAACPPTCHAVGSAKAEAERPQVVATEGPRGWNRRACIQWGDLYTGLDIREVISGPGIGYGRAFPGFRRQVRRLT
jgi:hypothetical protein